MKRQKFRKLLSLISFLLFPVTMWYVSPYLIIQAATEHIINGSFIVFCCMFIGSMFFGRAWCGYLCPAGGLQECAMKVNDASAKQGWRNKIKFFVWAVLIAAVVTMYILGKNDVTIDFFYMTDHGISVTGIYNYVIYYGVIILIVMPALLHGRRAFCHYICWMAPFMIIGGKIGQALHFPQLHIVADRNCCISCKKCNIECPMGLNVETMVQKSGNSKYSECILCGSCVDTCPRKCLHYSLKWEK